MFKFKILSLLAAVVLIMSSCADENALPIVTFDTAGKGAYPRLISQSDKLINLFDIAGSKYEYTVEFVDQNRGADVAEYVLEMTYENNNGGASVGPVEYKRWSASEFSANAGGYQQAPTITITANDAFAAAGVSESDVMAGDNFKFTGKVILNDGSTFTQSNSSSTVYGAAFRGHFNFTLPAACPSDLGGTYSYESSVIWCGAWDGNPVTGEVDIVAQGGGVYNFSDWSFGGFTTCYGGIIDQPAITFTEVCAEVSFTGFVDSYGDTWTFDSSIDGENWNITWENTYGESGAAVITFPGGVPFTLK